jgi:segregation and condensation protein B
VEVDHEGWEVDLDLDVDEDLELDRELDEDRERDQEQDHDLVDDLDDDLVDDLDDLEMKEEADLELEAERGEAAGEQELEDGVGEREVETPAADGPAAAAGPEPRPGSADGVAVAAVPEGGASPLGTGQPEAGFAIPLDPDAPDKDPSVRLRRDLEAILLVADQPVTAAALGGILEQPVAHVEDVLVDLAAEYAGDQRGFVLRAVAGGWRLYTHPASHPAVDAYMRAGTQQRLTQAALETLAVIAYRQPVTRAHVAAVRGVNVDGVLRTLLNRGLVAEVGRDEGPGQAVLYGTTPLFLEQLGLNGVHELPPVADYLPEGVDLSGLEENW